MIACTTMLIAYAIPTPVSSLKYNNINILESPVIVVIMGKYMLCAQLIFTAAARRA